MATSTIKVQLQYKNRLYPTQVKDGDTITLTNEEKNADIIFLTFDRYGLINFAVIDNRSNFLASTKTPIPGYRSISIAKDSNSNIVISTTSADLLNLHIGILSMGGGN